MVGTVIVLFAFALILIGDRMVLGHISKKGGAKGKLLGFALAVIGVIVLILVI